VLEVIERDQLADNARDLGRFVTGELQRLIRKFPAVLKEVRGFGLMIGLEFRADAPGFRGIDKTPALQVVERLHAAGVLTSSGRNRSDSAAAGAQPVSTGSDGRIARD
jgi:4-aminobutyrate aminotransferase and related aminotransferases